MKLESKRAIRCLLPLLFFGPALGMADSKAVVPFVVDAIEFKENGRFHERSVAECAIDGRLREAVAKVTRVLERRQSRRKSSANVESPHFTLRIDKVGTLGSVRYFGTEIGVTAIPAGQTTGQLFLCQARYKPFQLSACERIDDCVEKIADDVASWVTKVSQRDSE